MPLPPNVTQAFELMNVNNADEARKFLSYSLTFPSIKTLEKVHNKPHYKYLLNYLFLDEDGLKAKTIVIENQYTSLSYVEDYLNYYAECYYPYLKDCRRIHFFDKTFSREDFIQMICFNMLEDYWDSYLGYIVLKPIPKGSIGASILKPYDKKPNRHYTAIKSHSANIFGREIKFETMSYQEQDGIVGSCSSAALWFAFEKTSELFQSKNPAPSEITMSAGYDSKYTGKSFPSSMLETQQICQAVFSTGLISELRDSDKFLNNNKWLKSFVYAYSRMGIPVLLGLHLEKFGGHLVAVNGYRLGDELPEKSGDEALTISLTSERIIKFYAHDDQSGPFSRLEFLENSDYTFLTSLWSNVNEEHCLKAEASVVVVPIKRSIRVTFEDILEQATVLHYFLKRKLGLLFEWDIYLIESNKYKIQVKDKIIRDPENYDQSAIKILFKSLPKYIWVAQAKIKIERKTFLVFDLLYDAIDVNYENSPYFANIYSSDFKEKIRKFTTMSELPMFAHIFPEKTSPYSNILTQLNEDTYAKIESFGGDAVNEIIKEKKGDTTVDPFEILEEIKKAKFEQLLETISKKIIDLKNSNESRTIQENEQDF